ncbi:MAG: hypothetical protein ACREX3_05745 [Gammaproteobacteria bacterium]
MKLVAKRGHFRQPEHDQNGDETEVDKDSVGVGQQRLAEVDQASITLLATEPLETHCAAQSVTDGENFWARGYFVSTVGLEENMVRASEVSPQIKLFYQPGK